MKRRTALFARLLVALLASTLTLTACAQSASKSDGRGSGLIGPRWIATSVNQGGRLTQIPAELSGYIQFNADNTVTGSDGANALQATFDIRGHDITFTNGITSGNGGTGITAVSAVLKDALDQLLLGPSTSPTNSSPPATRARWTLNGRQLTLRDGRTTITFAKT